MQVIMVLLLVFTCSVANAEMWKVTAYCQCSKCCGKSDGITASGKKAKVGMVACNWLPFGTEVVIDTLGTYMVQDRGAKRYFGSKSNPIKALDVFFETHEEAKRFGVKHLNVEVIK